MAVKLVAKSGKAEIGDIQNYTLNVESIPTDATDSSGSTGTLDINAPGTFTQYDQDGNRVNLTGSRRSTALLGREVYLSDFGASTQTSNITGASFSGGIVTFTCNNTASIGWYVDVSRVNPSSYNVKNAMIINATPTTFSVAMNAPGAYVSGGSARLSDSLYSDYQGTPNGRGTYHGNVSAINISGSNLSISVDGVLFRMNAEKTAQPHFGPGATIKTAFIYYCSLAGITVNPDDVEDDFDTPIAYPGWKGNLWEYIKMFCIANKADILVGPEGNVILKKMGAREIFVDEASGVSRTITALGTSRTVELYDYDCSWEDDTVIFEAKTSYQVNMGERIKELVDITNSTTTDKIIKPVCVQAIQPIPFEGGVGKSPYVVIDNLNIPVSPKWWNDNGGKVTVTVSEENPMQLELIIQAPNQPNSAYTEPFRIAEYDTEPRPALYICGEGVKVTKTFRKVDTGADRTFIAKDSKATIDNPFINDASFHLLQAAAYATGPTIDLSLTLPFTQLQNEFTELPGARFFYDSGYYRVKTATINSGSVSINAKVDTRFDDIINIYSVSFNTFTETSGFEAADTFTTFNTQYSGQVFNEFNDDYPARTFEQLEQYYTDMTFNEMTINPLGDTLYKYGN